MLESQTPIPSEVVTCANNRDIEYFEKNRQNMKSSKTRIVVR